MRRALLIIGLIAAGAAPAALVASPALSGHDATPPQTSITGGPGARTTDRTPTFTFASSEKLSRFVCKRDGERFSPCSSPVTLGRLARGRHGFYVRAIDRFDNRDTSAAAYGFKVVRP